MEWKMVCKLQEEEEEKTEEKEEGEERRWAGEAPKLESIYTMKILHLFPGNREQENGGGRHECQTNKEMQRAHPHAGRFSGGEEKRG